jgi:hypothetical protein
LQLKVIAAYNIFNGLEIFHKSIEYTRSFVDQIILIYQQTSYRGNHNPDVVNHIEQYPEFKSFEFEPDMALPPKDNELIKQNWMLELARDQGGTHMILMDCDHIYQPENFRLALDKAKQYDVSWTKMFTYFKHPTWQLDPPEDYYMPFLIKLYPHTEFVKGNIPYPVRVDPTLRINTFQNYHIFPIDQFAFHHYSMVRADINEKFRNSPSRPYEYWKQHGYIDEWENYDIELNPGVQYFSGRKIKVVDNYFDI